LGLLIAHDDGSLLRFAGQTGWWTRARPVIAETHETVLRERRYLRPFESHRAQVHARRLRLMSPAVRSWPLRSWMLQKPRPAHRRAGDEPMYPALLLSCKFCRSINAPATIGWDGSVVFSTAPLSPSKEIVAGCEPRHVPNPLWNAYAEPRSKITH
jgi:hypothetical protein